MSATIRLHLCVVVGIAAGNPGMMLPGMGGAPPKPQKVWDGRHRPSFAAHSRFPYDLRLLSTASRPRAREARPASH